MDLNTYEKLIRTESSARSYLLGYCWKNHQRFCPRCRASFCLASGATAGLGGEVAEMGAGGLVCGAGALTGVHSRGRGGRGAR